MYYGDTEYQFKSVHVCKKGMEYATNRPQCNGKNERVNQTLVAKLRCKVNSTTKTPWTKLLEQVTYGYNNSPHDVTGFPPAYLMFGTLPYDSPLPNQVQRALTNRHHATQQNVKLHFCHAQHHRLSRYGIEDCFTVQTPKSKRLFNAYDKGERILEKPSLLIFGCKNGISSLKKKEHLIELAEELGLIVEASLTKPKLRDLIVKSPDYIEDDVKVMIDSIVKDRIRTEEEKLRREQREYEEKLRREEREYELEKLRMQAERMLIL
ncbi:retrotransposable element Tf2 protein type 3-like protein [Trichonephila clavipes]|nr:retrotransposable element Tf2 protein type 3-like protein [Trichonephila clavipes]